jgi:hypothetical protein
MERIFLYFCLILTALIPAFIIGQTVSPELTPVNEVQNIIDNLGNNEGKFLPNFTCIDVYNGDGLAVFSSFATSGPGIRDYCRKWVYANSRERALYCGGNHGSPHRFNDMWEFDLASNTWVMLHKPDAGASPVHTWWGFTYDQKRDLAYWMCVAGPWLSGTPPLFVYDPYAQSGWTIKSHPSGTPNIRSQGSQFEYIPDKDICIWYDKQWNGSGMLEWNPETNTWTELLGQSYTYHGCDTCPQQEAVTNYDSLENVLISMRDSNIYRYDMDGNTWHHMNSGPFTARDNGSGYAYDPDNGVHVLVDDRQIFAYRASTNTVEVKNPAGLDTLVEVINSNWNGNREVMLFYHRALKVFVVYLDGFPKVWVYKYGSVNSVEETATAYDNNDNLISVVPNPFHSGTVIRVNRGRKTEGRRERVMINIYNVNGKLVDNLTSGILWNPLNLPAGIYMAAVTIGNKQLTKKIILTK